MLTNNSIEIRNGITVPDEELKYYPDLELRFYSRWKFHVDVYTWLENHPRVHLSVWILFLGYVTKQWYCSLPT